MQERILHRDPEVGSTNTGPDTCLELTDKAALKVYDTSPIWSYKVNTKDDALQLYP
jgi:hypothetical protein